MIKLRKYLKLKVLDIKKIIQSVREKTFVLFCIGFIAGNLFYFNSFWILIIISPFTFINKFRSLTIIMAGIVTGFGYICLTDLNLGNKNFLEKTTLSGIVLESKQESFFQTLLVAESLNVSIKVKAPLYPIFSYGDKILANGNYVNIQNKLSEFDYISYLKSQNIWREFNAIVIEKTNSTIFSFLNDIRTKIFLAVREHTLPPESGIIEGIIIGTKSNLDEEILQSFNYSGLTHILSVSGFNFSILYIFALKVFTPLNRYKRLIIAQGLILFFLFIVGVHNLPALRATVMILVLTLSQFFGRKISKIDILAITMFLLILVFPFVLINISFLLSMGATIALLIFFKNLEFEKSVWGEASSIILATIAINVITLPITFFLFGEFSLVSLISNVLVLPFMPLLMLCFALGFGFWIIKLEFFAHGFFLILENGIKYITKLTEILGKLEFSKIDNSTVFLFYVFICIGVLFIFDFRRSLK